MSIQSNKSYKKSLREYLLEGGIKGRFFKGTFNNCNLYGEGIYEVIDMNDGDHIVNLLRDFQIEVRHLTGSDTERTYSYDLRERFLDVGATSEEVKRAKESQLAQKISENARQHWQSAESILSNPLI